MIKPRYLHLSQHIDHRGRLIYTEQGRDFQFPIKRAFWITDAPKDAVRGGTANRENHQIMIAVVGVAVVTTPDAEYRLDRPWVALHVPPNVFVEVELFNAVLLVLCSKKFDPQDYIHPE
jgi:hypothetical protein